ncbi:MAG: polyprenyl synthetase family protein [Candidatus Micrarchaeia archaeon]
MDDTKDNSINELLSYMKTTSENVNRAINEYLNDKSSPRSLERMLGRSGYSFNPEAIEKAVIEPSRYILEAGGKRIRPLIMLTAIEAMGKNPDDFLEFSIIPEIIHTGTLIHDDIEDGSELRRNKPTIHKKYGIELAINLGDFMFYFPIVALLDSKKIRKSVKTRILETYQRDMLRLGIGQGVDLVWNRLGIDPSKISESEYFETAYSKTGVLTCMAAEMGAILGGGTKKQVRALGKYGATIGIAFQLQDDILNITESKVADNKGRIGEDITEGKMTLLVIRASKVLPEDDKKRLIEILGMHTTDPALIQEAINLIKKSDAIEYVNKKKEQLVKESIEAIDKALPESKAKERLKQLADFIINRSA